MLKGELLKVEHDKNRSVWFSMVRDGDTYFPIKQKTSDQVHSGSRLRWSEHVLGDGTKISPECGKSDALHCLARKV
jgi:hypothetical protein